MSKTSQTQADVRWRHSFFDDAHEPIRFLLVEGEDSGWVGKSTTGWCWFAPTVNGPLTGDSETLADAMSRVLEAARPTIDAMRQPHG